MNANLYALFESHFPDNREQPVLLIPGGDAIRYEELAAALARIAHALVAAGCQPGDRVAVQTDKHWQVLALYLGCLRAGLVYLPLNTGYQKGELAHFFGDAEPRVIVCRADARDSIAALDPPRRSSRWTPRAARSRSRRARRPIPSPRSRVRRAISPRCSIPPARRAAPKARCSPTATSRRTR